MDLLEPQSQNEMDSENKMTNKAEQHQQGEELSLNKASENNSSLLFENMLRLSLSSLPPAGAQLTIFYNGSVSVYDAVTPAKAQAIMLIAAAASAVSAGPANKVPMAVGHNAGGTGTAAAAAAALTRSLSQQSSSAAVAAAAAGSPLQPQVLVGSNAGSLCKMQADLPIARRHSLQQFLEKRRNRLVSKAPYAMAKKSEGDMEVGVEGKPQAS